MIWVCSFLSLIFAFGVSLNPICNKLFAAALVLLFWKPLHRLKIGVVQWLALTFAVWMAICTYYSPFFNMSLEGFPLRSEGLLTWVILGVLAVAYWKTFRSLAPLRMILVPLVFVLMALRVGLGQETFGAYFMTEIALGGFAALVMVLFWSFDPSLAPFGIPILLFSNNRGAVIGAACGILLFCAFKYRSPENKRKWKISLAILCACVIALSFTPLAQKFMNIEAASMGTGSRSQWILQADKIARHHLPLTGFGVDTLSNYLEPAFGVTQHVNAIPDKTHNVIYDILLETGWIGLTLALLIYGAALGCAIKFPSEQNWSCISIVTTWVVAGFVNPVGIWAHALMLIALLGITSSGNAQQDEQASLT